MNYQSVPPPSKRGIPKWVWIAVPAFVLIMCCAGVGAAFLNRDNAAQSIDVHETTPTSVLPDEIVEETPLAEAPVAAPEPQQVEVSGNNNSVAQLNATLNGMFQVEYSGSSFCLIVKFLRADGSSGAGWMEDINECAANLDTKLSGTTLVNLTDVTMVHVENTQGAWTLRFTPM